jgi:hypothetical protein
LLARIAPAFLLNDRKQRTLLEFPMTRLKLLRISTSLIALAVLLSFQIPLGQYAAGTPRFDPRAHIERGDRVEKRYEAYSKRLAKHQTALITTVKQSAPSRLVHLQPREPILHGYQILPRITAGAAAERHTLPGPVAYSWPWTDRLIDSELEKIIHSEADLRRAQRTTAPERDAILEKLTQDYGRQSQQLRIIHAHIQHNRLWQAAIAADRSGYDRETALLGDVVERQRIVDRLHRMHAGVEVSRVSQARPAIAELTGGLRNRAALLGGRIDRAMSPVQPANFIGLETVGSEWIFHVPLFTDIEDQEYVRAVKRIIENSWRLKDGKTSFRIELDVAYVSAGTLYDDRDKPTAGKNIEIRRHLKRFPSGAAILTTGARTTHVLDNAIVLGPHPITPQVLAHEFGHILGFRDSYVRGYTNLGEHGFQVIEMAADRDDIMAATPQGAVRRGHFLTLLGRAARPDQNGREHKLISG